MIRRVVVFNPAFTREMEILVLFMLIISLSVDCTENTVSNSSFVASTFITAIPVYLAVAVQRTM
jgi:hypothetical protein